MNRFVADGRERLLADPETQKQIADATRRVAEKYQGALAEAGFWKRLWLRWRMYREINREVEKIAPSRGLYAAAGLNEPQNKTLDAEDARAS
jgi:hypothetical protein